MESKKIQSEKIPFFSIIIPVYNGLTHDLPICLNSIWNQPIDKSLYEVICIDDCSTDDTRIWLNQQQRKHNNLIVISNNVNIRQGGGRNRGTEKAIGKYIIFIDQDDYYHPESLVKMYNFLKKTELDVFVTDSAYQFKGHENNKLQLNLKHCHCTTGEKFVMSNGFVFAPWRMCINREFYVKHKILFPEKCRIEDVDWAITVTYYAEKMQYQPILLIHYNKGESGTTDNMYKNKEILIANILAGNRTLHLAGTLYKSSLIRECVADVADMYYNYSLKYMLGLWCSIKEKKEIISQINASKGKRLFVRQALKFPTLYCVFSTLTIPMFRTIRYIHRYKTARQREKE